MKATFSVLNKKHGFTLVELVLVIILIGALAAVGLPKFFDQSIFDERYFHDDLLSAARYAQRLATGSGCSVRLSVSTTSFSLDQDANCNLASPSYSISVNRPFDSEAFSNNDKPSSLTMTPSESAYYFLPKGGVIDSGGLVLSTSTVELSGVSSRIIYIVGATGYVYSI